jgi:hypothetical protein
MPCEQLQETVWMFEEMVSEIEGFINDHNPKSEELLAIRDIIEKHLSGKP